MKNSIVQKAEDTIKEYNKKVEDFETVCHAGICPVCGRTLTLNREVSLHTKTVGIIFKKEKTRKVVNVTIICPKGHELIHPAGWDAANTGYGIWQGCLNKEIDEYWKDNYLDDDDFE